MPTNNSDTAFMSKTSQDAIELGQEIDKLAKGKHGVVVVMALLACLGSRLFDMPDEMRPPELDRFIEAIPVVIRGLEMASRVIEQRQVN